MKHGEEGQLWNPSMVLLPVLRIMLVMMYHDVGPENALLRSACPEFTLSQKSTDPNHAWLGRIKWY